MREKCTLVGNLALDRNKIIETGVGYEGPGSPLYFGAIILSNLGLKVTVWSPRGADFPDEMLSGVNLLPEKQIGKATLIYENIYYPNGNRVQYAFLGDCSDIPSLSFLNKSTREKQDIVLVAPILDNLSVEYLSQIKCAFPNSLTTLMPSGFFRKVRKDGLVMMCDWETSEEVVPNFNLVILSEKDGLDLYPKAQKWSNLGPTVILTQEENGCMIYHQGQPIHVSAFKIDDIADPTGAGDIFAASFSFAYRISKDLKTSSHFANAAAGMSLRYFPNEMIYTYQDVINFAQSQGVKIKL